MYTSILLPIDLGEDSSWRKALPVARAIAGLSGATIHLMTVVPNLARAHIAAYFPPGFEETAFRETEARLAAFAAEHVADTPCTCHVARGTIYEEILDTAGRLGCDLVVMASHRPELADYLIGPNADRVVRHAPISVLVVRE